MKLIIDVLKLAVLIVLTFFVVSLYQTTKENVTELKKNNKNDTIRNQYLEKIFRVNSEFKNGVIDLSKNYKKR